MILQALLAVTLLPLAAQPDRAAYRPPARGVPTAEQLSDPGALQAWADDQAKTGRIDLPPGEIRVPQWRLVRYRNCRIEGWGTTIVGTDPSVPTIRQAQTGHLVVEGLKVVSASAVAWQQEHWPGAGTLGTKLSSVWVERAGWRDKGRGGVGLALATKPTDATCADVDIDFCRFHGFDDAIQVNGRQAVRVNVHATTEIAHCNTVVRVNAGGHVYLRGCGVIGAKTVCACGPEAGGSSLQPTIAMRDVYIDDAGQPTRLIDASRVSRSGHFVATLDGVKCNVPNGGGSGFDLILAPAGHRNYEIRVGLLTKTGKANTDPTEATP